jgi:hypothetical protein
MRVETATTSWDKGSRKFLYRFIKLSLPIWFRLPMQWVAGKGIILWEVLSSQRWAIYPVLSALCFSLFNETRVWVLWADLPEAMFQTHSFPRCAFIHTKVDLYVSVNPYFVGFHGKHCEARPWRGMHEVTGSRYGNFQSCNGAKKFLSSSFWRTLSKDDQAIHEPETIQLLRNIVVNCICTYCSFWEILELWFIDHKRACKILLADGVRVACPWRSPSPPRLALKVLR